MPKAVLEYNLPEETEEFDLAQNGSHYFCVIEDLDNYLRSLIKFGNLPMEKEEIYQEIRDKLHDLKNDF